jgi:hypothetical protein
MIGELSNKGMNLTSTAWQDGAVLASYARCSTHQE